MKGNTLTVEESTNDRIPVGTTLTVENHRTNQFTDREVITVRADPEPEHRITSFQMFRTGDNWWTEIRAGGASDEVRVS